MAAHKQPPPAATQLGPSVSATAGITADGSAVIGLARGEVVLALIGVLLTSLAFLVLQISASRLLSLLLSYHFVFAVVSLAMLGLGIGGAIARFAFAGTLAPRDSLRVLAGANAVAALAMLGGLALIMRIADRPFIAEPAGMLVVLAILLVPLIAAGLGFAQLFRSFAAISGRAYGADLAGAALGCVGVVLALDLIGGVGSLLLAAVLAAAGALAFAWPARGTGGAFGATAIVLAVLGLVFAGFVSGRYDAHVPIGANPDKEIHDALSSRGQGKIEASRWSSFGRTDLVGFGERRGFKDIYVDGTAGSPMYAFTGNFAAPGEAVERLVREFPGYFPFRFMADKPRERALVIGPGGGRDVLLARMAGFAHVRAIEVNPDLVALVRDESAYNGDLFGPREDVEVIVDEGRSFVRRDTERYDVIMLSLPVTNTSRSREGFALTESFLLTKEALAEYVAALSPDGELAIVAHDEAAILRLVMTALAALSERGLSAEAAMERLYVLGSFPFPVFVLRQRAISEAEARAMLAEARGRGYSPAASYFPNIAAPGAVNPVLQALEQGRVAAHEVIRLAAERGTDIRPVSDDSPFFHHFDLAPPVPVVAVAIISGMLTLLILAAATLTAPRRVTEMRLLYPGLFLAIGIGFMLIEVSLVQRFMLFLGQPVHVLAVVLFVLLIGMSIGSVASSRAPVARTGRTLTLAGLAAAGLLAMMIALLPPLFAAALSLPLVARVGVAAAVLLPLGILLGMPFPLAIRALGEAGDGEHIPWMWALNGSASVVGAAAAILMAMQFGLSSVLAAALCCYLLVAAIGAALARRA